jgi:hypothetical protein
MASPRVLAAVALVALGSLPGAACGPSSVDVRRAQEVVYEAPFATVWNAVMSEVTDNYPQIEAEDAIHGYVRTIWRLVEAQSGDYAGGRNVVGGATGAVQSNAVSGTPTPTGSGTTAGNATGGGNTASILSQTGSDPRIVNGIYMRVNVRVKGPPWQVLVDGEAAELQPGMKMTYFRHGAADEPVWVAARLDDLRGRIYGRLKSYARDAGDRARQGTAAVAAAPAAAETSPWSNIPDKAAAAVIGRVRAAAKAKDTAALRGLMDAEFTWAAGGNPSADTAIAMWKADPSKLVALTKTLDGGCGEVGEGGGVVMCPRDPAEPGAHAVFKKVGGTWRFVVFAGK